MTAQEVGNAGKLDYHNVIRSLHKKTQEDYDVKRAEYTELKTDLIQHYEQSSRRQPTTVQRFM